MSEHEDLHGLRKYFLWRFFLINIHGYMPET